MRHEHTYALATVECSCGRFVGLDEVGHLGGLLGKGEHRIKSISAKCACGEILVQGSRA